MKSIKYTFWKDDKYYIGFINDYPDYMTQALTKEELKDSLKSILCDIESNEIPYIRKVEDLILA